jgi:exopolysaccharide biosynthesis polyprenyl glycosylphosphotransferase
MFRRFSVNFAILSILLDYILTFLSLAIAATLRPILNILPGISPIYSPPMIAQPLFFILPLWWMVINLSSALYDGRQNLHFIDEFSKLIVTALIATGAMAGVLYLFFRETSRALFLFFVLIAFLSMLLWRVIARTYWRLWHREETNKRQVLIIGAGKVGRRLALAIRRNTNHHIHLLGFLDDDPQEGDKHSDVLGPLDALVPLLESKQIDDIVIALPPSAYEHTVRIIESLRMTSTKIWIIPDSYKLVLSGASVEIFAGIPLLDARTPALSDYQRVVKRVFDLILASFSIILAAPVMAVIALMIKLDSRGPILFLQKRVGENRCLFDMFKFRTMVEEAESLRHTVEKLDEKGNIIHKDPEDPRVTLVGRFLRRYSLDELPQLLNVLKGDMSLVGPRPELPYMVEKYEPWQFVRFSIPQGMTGWWQINGRSNRPMHLNTQDDLYYIENYSFWLDIKILLRTLIVVAVSEGAY